MTRVPDEADTCSLSCYVRQGMTGTAWFDDVQMVRVADPPLRSVVTSPVYPKLRRSKKIYSIFAWFSRGFPQPPGFSVVETAASRCSGNLLP